MMPAGSINTWKCDMCGGLTTAIHADEGVTPMFLTCRSTPGCEGRAVSAGYPPGETPPHILASLRWEWRKASATQVKRWRREDPTVYEHCRLGGLVLEPLSERGRQAPASPVGAVAADAAPAGNTPEARE